MTSRIVALVTETCIKSIGPFKTMEATVVEPMFQYGTTPVRCYIVLDVQGHQRRCKVPFRYNRVMCRVSGGKTIQELVKGDVVNVEMEFTGGVWKLLSVQSV